jgi:hypothetical protein
MKRRRRLGFGVFLVIWSMGCQGMISVSLEDRHNIRTGMCTWHTNVADIGGHSIP